MPFDGKYCHYFLRFASKTSDDPTIGGRSCPDVHYIFSLTEIARAAFGPDRIQMWESGMRRLMPDKDLFELPVKHKVGTTSSNNNNTPKAYAIQEIPGKGFGMAATREIHRGTRILIEAPLFRVPRVSAASNQETTSRLLSWSIPSSTRPSSAISCRSPTRSAPKKLGPFWITRTNAPPLGLDKSPEGGIFLEAARINHACPPNV
ncbi:hypothetical protein Sste5346_002388 [Sporothrix stenoceras]|uniref:SET domain-containing protein n=1 Tax=Sporothrix stenoceras TaxID=5173 RepID=A0ABR3ZIY3_9PEZI